MRLKEIYLLALTLILSGFYKSQEFAEKSYYLIDSLELELIQKPDSILIEESLRIFHDSKNVSIKIDAIQNIIEESWDDKVWPNYNDWLIDYIEQKLKSEKKQSNIDVLNINYSRALNNKGFYYDEKGITHKAIEFYEKGLKIQEKYNDQKGLADTYNNIGYIHQKQGDTLLTIKYYKKSLESSVQANDKSGIATSYNNLGYIYQYTNSDSLALFYYLKSLKICNEINDKQSIAIALNNIGSIYLYKNEIDSALLYCLQSYKTHKEINNKEGISNTGKNIATIYFKQGNNDAALIKAKESFEIAKEIGYAENIQYSSHLLYKLYLEKSNFKKALEMRNLEIQMKDSLTNLNTLKLTAKKQAQYEYEKKSIADSIIHENEQALKEAEIDKQQIEIKAKQNQQYFLIASIVIILSFLVFIFNRLKITRKQKEEIDQQKSEIEAQKLEVEFAHEQLAEHHQEIKDSINYAKRIQDAIMPSMEAMNEALGNGFVLYLPKDVVAGDFFWMETSTSSDTNQEIVYFAAADCTGHGVPGAMVSVVCSNALTKALLEEKITDTGKLLDRTRELVITQLAKSGEEVKDGMDISLCALNKKTMKLNWSGANNPLWILRKDESDFEIIKADKQPIGVTFDPSDFTSHNIQLNKGDRIYVFTDGYQDQFGGEKGKKFKAAQLKQILVDHKNTNIYEQEKILLSAFNSWKGELEQIDDICIIGLEV